MDDQSEMKLKTQARYEGEERPAYVMPKVKYPSYQDFANEGPAEPMYSESRGYIEHR